MDKIGNKMKKDRPRHSTSLFSLLFCAATVLVSGNSAAADDLDVGEFHYTNNGAYAANFYVAYKREGKRCIVRQPGKYKTDAGAKTVKVNLSGEFGRAYSEISAACLNERRIPPDTRVWGYIDIILGQNDSCKKNKVLTYRGGATGVQKYKSGGTTTNKNRCKHG